MNDIGSIPEADKTPRLVISLKPTGVPNQSQVNVQHFNIDGWESALALVIEGLKLVDGARRKAAAQGNGEKKIITANFVPPKNIGRG